MAVASIHVAKPPEQTLKFEHHVPPCERVKPAAAVSLPEWISCCLRLLLLFVVVVVNRVWDIEHITIVRRFISLFCNDL